jgi:hypothetical protein
MSRIGGAIPPLPNTPSWRGAQSTETTLPFKEKRIQEKKRERNKEQKERNEKKQRRKKKARRVIYTCGISFQVSGISTFSVPLFCHNRKNY